MHQRRPVLLHRLAHQLQREPSAEHRRKIAVARHIQVLAQIIPQIVGVQVQLGAVHEVHAGVQNRRLLFVERREILRRHRRFDAHRGDILLRRANVLNHAVGRARRAQIEPKLVQPRLAQRAQVFLRGQRAVCVQMLMDARVPENPDDAVILLDLHERLQIHI